MGKRHRRYWPNRDLTVDGFKITISANGAAYHARPDGHRKLDSVWHSKTEILSVVLPNEKTIRLKPTATGIELVEDEAENQSGQEAGEETAEESGNGK